MVGYTYSMLRLFALTIDGQLFHWTTRGWELFTGGLHQRPVEFKDATEGRHYLNTVKLDWPEGTIDKYFSDPVSGSFLGTHDIRPFEIQ